MDSKKQIQPPVLDKVKKSIQKSREKVDTDSYTISIVTPMFGGGIQPGVVNKKNPIRSSSIRGHLRFWWRATRGAACQNVRELRKREVEIFGDAHTPSRVKIWVETTGKPELEKVRELNKNNNKHRLVKKLPSYAVFPFNNNDCNNLEMLEAYTFQLHVGYNQYFPKQKGVIKGESPLTVKDLKEEIKPALWAWINFGGLGSRTRRGCGSLYCEDFLPERTSSHPKYEDWYQKKIGDYELNLDIHLENKEWPTLSKSVIIQEHERDSLQAWKDVIKLYHNFRSLPNNTYVYSKTPDYKRSLWPEADSLRRISGMAELVHKPPKPLEKKEIVAFPRAQLGLPIIFEFKQDKYLKERYNSQREPYKMQLAPKDKSRLASPLITKVLALDEKRGVGMIVKLNQPRLTDLELKVMEDRGIARYKLADIEKVERLIAKQPIREDAIYKELRYAGSPMKQGQQSAVQAFLDSEEVQSWKKR
ncbi:type III-B CRISPR module RAMP protein Cmr1 [Paenibacillus albidus]|uniref:type III-B CRISPR module RAMP protein Cmr1 n=1 Tax=Paenibacillus albidus TaxID=2041023 RepID=UPI001BE9E7B9|nr:type III-B CRISPR module RAMP protein Cmr1 [Paenibacillus albidus]MBT2288280.1 type III-B CRISPR module RAMP protein Cmr1 [Paenibacillus albidus]